MAEILGAGFVTLTDLVSEIRTAVHDTGAITTRKWSDDEIYLAIKRGLGAASNTFFYQDIYEDHDFADGDIDYTLPDYVQRVIKVERERTIPDIETTTGTTLDWEELKNWRQVRTPGANRLLFLHDYPTGNSRITYERDVQFPIVDMKLSAAITSGATTCSVSIPGTYNVYQILAPVYFQINNLEIVKCTAVTAPATLTITRGSLGTTAAAASEDDLVTPVIIENDDRFSSYIIHYSAGYLNLLQLQDTKRGADVAGNVTAMREFFELANNVKRQKSERRKPRRIQSERVRKGGRL